MIGFRLDARSGVPTYLQLVNQVKHALRLGLLEPGDRLPTAAEVVAALAINPNTVLKAYRELEREGLVAARPGTGTFVQRTLGRVGAADRARLHRQLVTWMRSANAAGLDREDVEALFEAARQDVAEDVA
ncbi:GntR family transcriptional regulator [Asanoa ishikariensis]|uniref:GntR family transcriptional regulator n=1 Tax=Asanoa ishikariensis TaxID=137265 RepID=A0A1H3UHY4_9ACTN|nr:GntR family transcriptional regulator [Asanoa ishikariensis]GIF63477.1 GntR family transcriptional regulator [Asanoa ishikariensis]SDZ62018.1 GntR family transcriptional regulator [Asanoa ishikariensis]